MAQQLLNGIAIGAVYAMFGVGFTLIFGVHRILNLAHGVIFAWGAVIGHMCVTRLGMPFPAALLTAAIAAGLISVATDMLVFAPLRRRGAPEFSIIVASLGAAEILLSLAQRATQTKTLRFPFGTLPDFSLDVGIVRFSFSHISMILAGGLFAIAILAYLHKTPFGSQVRAVATSERTAMLLGVNPKLVYFQTFFLSGALAGAAGVLVGVAFHSVNFQMGEPYLLIGIAVIVLGGMGSVMGAVLAGAIIGVLESLSIAYASSGVADALPFVALFAILIFRPAGLLGSIEIGQQVEARP